MLIMRVEIPESCGSGLADFMDPQVRDSRCNLSDSLTQVPT